MFLEMSSWYVLADSLQNDTLLIMGSKVIFFPFKIKWTESEKV